MTGTVLTCSGADFSRPLMMASGSEHVAASSVPDSHKLDAMLDDALNQTFPASDPIALSLNLRN